MVAGGGAPACWHMGLESGHIISLVGDGRTTVRQTQSVSGAAFLILADTDVLSLRSARWVLHEEAVAW